MGGTCPDLFALRSQSFLPRLKPSTSNWSNPWNFAFLLKRNISTVTKLCPRRCCATSKVQPESTEKTLVIGIPRTVQENATKQTRMQTQRLPADVWFAHSDQHGGPPFAHLCNALSGEVSCWHCNFCQAQHRQICMLLQGVGSTTWKRLKELTVYLIWVWLKSVSGKFVRILGMDHEDSNYTVQRPRFQFPVPQSLCSCAKWTTLHWQLASSTVQPWATSVLFYQR